MKKYSEEQGAEPFNWSEALDKKINGKPDAPSPIELRIEAADWVTCAVGNQCSTIPRDLDGAPKDEELRFLGSEFMHYIDKSEYETALLVLEAIERRSAHLIEFHYGEDN